MAEAAHIPAKATELKIHNPGAEAAAPASEDYPFPVNVNEQSVGELIAAAAAGNQGAAALLMRAMTELAAVRDQQVTTLKVAEGTIAAGVEGVKAAEGEAMVKTTPEGGIVATASGSTAEAVKAEVAGEKHELKIAEGTALEKPAHEHGHKKHTHDIKPKPLGTKTHAAIAM